MRADVARIWTSFRLVIVLATVAGVFSFLAVSFLNDGLAATRAAQSLRDFGVVANVTDARIHVSRDRSTSTDSTTTSGSGSASSRSNSRSNVNGGFWIDQVQVMFTDPQGQKRSESLGSFVVQGTTPRAVGWTTQFEDHVNFVGKEVRYLPNQPGQAQMHDQMLSTLSHGFEPVHTYIGTALSVLALVCWAVFAWVVIGRLRPWMAGRRLSGIA